MKPAAIAVASIAGTLGVVAAIGLAQPDGLQPPAGPIDDTQPSLASISQQIGDLHATGVLLPNLQVEVVRGLQDTTKTALAGVTGPVRIHSVAINGGGAQLSDAAQIEFASLTGGTWDPRQDDFATVGSSQLVLGGLEVEAPVTIDSFGYLYSAEVSIYYWVEGDAQ